MLIDFERRRHAGTILAAWAFPAVNLAYIAASASKLANPQLMDGPLLLSLPLILLWIMPWRAPGKLLVWWAIIAALFLAWNAGINAFNPWAPNRLWGTWCLHALALSTALIVGNTCNVGLLIRHLGLSTAAAVGLSALCVWPMMHWSERPYYQCLIYGFNQSNQFVLLVPPPLIAWLLWAWRRPPPEQCRWWEWLAISSALMYALHVSLVTAKRAVLVAFVVVVLAAILRPVLRHLPRITAAGAAGLILVAGLLLWRLVAQPTPFAPLADAPLLDRASALGARIDPNRPPLFRMAATACSQSYGIGMGYGALLAIAAPTQEDAVTKHSQERWLTAEAHCEWLQRLAEGGVPSLLLFVGLIVMVIVPAWSCPDRGVAAAVQSLGLAALVSLTFHGIYQHPLPLYLTGLWVGSILCVARQDSPNLHRRLRHGLLAVTGALALLLPTTCYSAWARPEYGEAATARACAVEWLPFAADWHALTLASIYANRGDFAAVDAIEAQTVQRIGPHVLVPVRYAGALRLPPGEARQNEFARWLSWHPTDVLVQEELFAYPPPKLSVEVRRRLDWLAQRTPLPITLPLRPQHLNDVADVLAAALASIHAGHADLTQIQSQIAHLAHDWYSLPDVNWSLIRLISAAPELGGPWLSTWRGTDFLSSADEPGRAAVLARFTSRAQLQAITPLVLRVAGDRPPTPSRDIHDPTRPSVDLGLAWWQLAERCRAFHDNP